MGKLVYGGGVSIEMDDRALAHLQIVIAAKLRRQEPFFLTWTDDVSTGSGRSSIWLDKAIPLYFSFSSAASPAINRQWLDMLIESANQAQGLRFLDEPGAITAKPKANIRSIRR